MGRLSKSRIMSSLQCLKRVHLEVNRRDLAKYSSATEAAFALGHAVGDIAVKLYDDGRGTMVEYSGGSFAAQLELTRTLMTSMVRAPVFEATIEHEGVLVREDVLLPTDDGAWRMVEVKSSTKLKPDHVQDCAIQAWVHLGAGHSLDRIALAHIDNQFVYQGDELYQEILVEHEITKQVLALQPSVPLWVERALAAVEGPMPEVPVGAHCKSPYECPFIDFCWPNDSAYPIRGLGGGLKKLGEWVEAGYRDIRDVPVTDISNETQLRIRRITTQGAPELLPGAREFVRALPYPRFYLDFETVSPAIPFWTGTRPYQVLPFQWSCHIERETGTMDHAEFLDLTGEPPMRKLAEAMISTLGENGPVLMYTAYERQVIQGLIGMFPDLEDDLASIIERLVDLHPVTKAYYYHPDMLGSWSIKAVLPTIAPDMDYAGLEGIQEGTQASRAYLEAIDKNTQAGRKKALEQDLLRYCRHDTEAMVRLVRYFESSDPTSA